ncbi:unnamed protein product, partial [Iphiclides podalirius]
MDDNPSEGEDDQNEISSGAGGDVDFEEGSDEEEIQFDKSLAATHSYMGPGLVAVRRRSVLEAGWRGRVPVTAHTGAIFPGETVPLLFSSLHDAEMVSRLIAQDKLFGLLFPDESGTMVSGYGVLCEVFETRVSERETAGAEGAALTFKARATHRFRLVERAQPMHAFARMRPAEVRVLPEAARERPAPRPPRPLRQLRAALTPWPLFLHDLFGYERVRDLLRDHFHFIPPERLPDDPVSLSFWVASNLALSARDRLALFKVDDALLRLHMALRFIARKSVLCCAACMSEVARREHILAMSSEGVHANFTNLGGYMHDVVTVSRASNTRLSGRPSADYSWFPGYAWTIAVCRSCATHLGWRFDAIKRNLRPLRFFGLCRNYMQPRADDDDEPDRL